MILPIPTDRNTLGLYFGIGIRAYPDKNQLFTALPGEIAKLKGLLYRVF